MEVRRKPSKEPGKLWQLLAATVVNLSALSYGSTIGWQSPYAPQLQSSLSPVGKVPMTDDEVSWLSAIKFISGSIVTALLSLIPHKFSRKRFGYVTALQMGISWLIIVFSTEHAHIYVARFLCGMSGACMFFLVTMYISEISSDGVRGLLGSILTLSLNLGVVLAYILGGVMSFHNFAIFGMAQTTLFAVAFAFMPESPVYLIRQNRIREAVGSLMWLRGGHSLTVERTVSHLQEHFKEIDKTAKSTKLADLFRDKATVKGLIIALGLFCSQQFSGNYIMVSYTETIFIMSGSTLSPNTATIIVGGTRVLGCYVASSLMERAGRRKLTLVSCMGICVCHCMMGLYFYFQQYAYNVSDYAWLPVIVLSIFTIMLSVGMAVVPIVVTSEIFSHDVSSLCVAVVLTFDWFVLFIVTKIYPYLIALFGIFGSFFFFATCCACSFLFCFILLPETKGRTREDIVNELNGVRRTESEMSMKCINETGLGYVDPV